MGSVSSTPPVGEPEREWEQPAFGSNEDDVAGGHGVVVPQPMQVPVTYSAPASVAEVVVSSLAGVVWPVMIVLAIFGVLAWWPAIIIALVASAFLGNIRGQLRSRRRALPPPSGPSGQREELR
jgi:hypothetical protein